MTILKRISNFHLSSRSVSGHLLALVLPVAVSLLFFVSSTEAQPAPQEMRLHMIDVGQGEAILIEFPCAAALIDTGGESNSEFDSTDALMGYLDGFFKRRTDLKNRLDLLVLSHPHIDHTRGAKQVLAAYKPKNVVTNGQTTGSGKLGQIAAQQYASDTEATPTKADDVGFEAVVVEDLPQGHGLTDKVIDPINCGTVDPKLQVLWGAHRQNPGWTKAVFADANNHSVVLRLDFGDASFLFSGDLEKEAITDLVSRYKDTTLLDVDVYKVGHHGSDNATTAEFLKAITPKMAVMSMGPKDREDQWTAWAYGHPRKSTIDLLLASVAGTRPDVTFSEATAVKTFTPVVIKKAIYATGWDGAFVLQAKTDGTVAVMGTGAAPTAKLVNINTAVASQLAELPTLGPKRAAAVVKYRTKRGLFKAIDELRKVPGIGPATFNAVRDLVTVGD
jgi:competence protein ComEC